MTASHPIESAVQEIDPVFLNSPQFQVDSLNAQLGCRLTLKVETLNPIRSFKGRGTDYYVRQNLDVSHFVCASAGNFGQGMGYACRQHGRELTVFAAVNANRLKLDRMRDLGATVVLEGHDFDAAKEAAKRFAADHQLTYVEDGREPEVTIGAGTIGYELGQEAIPFDALLIPVGNGALINGIGSWFKHAHPSTDVIGVVAQNAPSMALSWRAGKAITTDSAETIADGIGVRVPVPIAVTTMRDVVQDVIEVSEEAILDAMRPAHHQVGLVLEPAGAAGLAAAIAQADRFAGKSIATVLCGSNLTESQIEKWL